MASPTPPIPRPPPRRKRGKVRPSLPALLLPLGLTMADPAKDLLDTGGAIAKDIKRSRSMDGRIRNDPEGASTSNAGEKNSEVLKRRSLELKPPASPSFASFRPRSAGLRRKKSNKSSEVKKNISDARRNSISGDITNIAMKKGAEVKELLRNSFRIKAGRGKASGKAAKPAKPKPVERTRSNSEGGGLEANVNKWLDDCSRQSMTMETLSETEALGDVSSPPRKGGAVSASFHHLDDPDDIDDITEAADLEDIAIALNMSAHLPPARANKVVENARRHTQLKINLSPPLSPKGPSSAPSSPTAKLLNKTVFNLSNPRKSLTLSVPSSSVDTDAGANMAAGAASPTPPPSPKTPTTPVNFSPKFPRPSSPKPTTSATSQLPQPSSSVATLGAASAPVAAAPSSDSPKLPTSKVTTSTSETIISKAVIKLNQPSHIGLPDVKEKTKKMANFDEGTPTSTLTSKRPRMSVDDDLFECGICTEALVIPKSLPCLHNFCLQCLEKYFSTNNIQDGQEFRCPTCRARASVPQNGGAIRFPTNFHIENLRKRPKRKNMDVERIVKEALSFLEEKEIDIIETLAERKRSALAGMGNHRELFVTAIDKYIETMQVTVEDKYAADSSHIAKVIQSMKGKLEDLQKNLRDDSTERDTVQQLRFQGEVITNIANELEEIKTKVNKEVKKVLRYKNKFEKGDSTGIRLSHQFGRLLMVEMDDKGKEISRNGKEDTVLGALPNWYHNWWMIIMGILPAFVFCLILRSIFNMVKEL